MKYGYGAFRILGETWECPSVQKVAKKFQEIFPEGGIDDVAFEQANALGQLALAGIENAGTNWGDLPELDDVVNELLFVDSTKINVIMTAFTESFPKPETGNAEPRSKARKAATEKK